MIRSSIVDELEIDSDLLAASSAGSVIGTTSCESAVVDQLPAQWVSDGL